MAGVADSAVGAILEIPPQMLQKIDEAEKAIKRLGATSTRVARSVSKDWGTIAITGLDAFIKKIKEAQNKVGGIALPNLNSSGFAASVSQIAQSLAAIDRSSITGAKRLGKIVDAVSGIQIAQPFADMLKEIANGIVAIGNTSQQTIQNVSTLAQSMAQLAKDIRTVQSAQRAHANDSASVAQYNKLYREQASLVRQKNELERKGNSITAEEQQSLYAIKQRYAEITRQLVELNRKKQSAATLLAQVSGGQNVANASNRTTITGAIDYAKQAKSLRELQDAYKNLKSVLATINPNDPRWAEANRVYRETKSRIDALRKSMGEFQSQSVSLSNIINPLSGRLAAAFSVAAITGYIRKMVEVRGEFELQNVALRAILQNKDEADKIFMQVQQMALQSPFSIMQMTTFTKQLAAYRIESEKLVDTTKMLADVSAGLGVDMGRLILAYGQVKSANYLRACLGLGTPVMLYNGTFKNVEDIVVGDVLMGDDEIPRHVSKLYQGEQQMYRVIYDGGEFRCNEHHILTVYDALTERIDDIFVFDYLKEPHRYQGVKRVGDKFEVFPMKVVADKVDTYYGFSIDGNHRFIIQDNIVTHNTEIRQFTEAGLNIAGELAQYFSELQGKMVSVGDVMEMVTKRMVRFEDVEEVFRRVTSAGGLFYDMQKKQSNTISGMLQRITDAYQIMLNDIGKSNQGTIQSALDLIRQMISHWRMLVPVIKTVGGMMAVAFVTKGIYAALMGMTKFVAALKAVRGGLEAMKVAATSANLAFSTTGIGLLITAALTLTSVFFGLREEAKKLQEALSGVQREGTSDMYNLIFQYRQLADVVKDSTKPYAERKEALDTLHRTYKDILPSEMLEIDNIRKMSDGYKEAVQAIEAFSAIKIKQKMYDTIDSEYGSKLTDAVAHDVNDITDVLYDQIKKISDYPKEEVKGAINNIMTTLTEEIKNGSVKLSDLDKEFKQRLYATLGLTDKDIAMLKKSAPQWDDFFKKYFEGYNVSLTKFGNQIDSELIEVFDKIEKERGKITDLGLPGITKMSREAQKQIQTYKDMESAVKDYKNALQRLKDEGITDVTVDMKSLDEMKKSALEAYNKASTAMGTYKLGVDEVNIALSSNMDLHETLRNVSNKTLTSILTNLEKIARETNNDTLLAWVQSTQREISKLNLTPAQQEIVKMIHEVENLNNVDLGNFQFAIIESTTTVTDARKNVEGQINQLKDSIEAYQNSILSKVLPTVAAMLFLDGRSLEEVNQQLKALELLRGKLGGGDKKTGAKGKDPELEMWKNRIKAVQDYYDAREKARKNLSAKEAETQQVTSFEQLWKELKLDKIKGLSLNDLIMQGFDPKTLQGDLVSSLEMLKRLIPTKYADIRKEIERTIAKEKIEIQFKVKEGEREQLQKSITDMFDNYALTKELVNLGVNVDLTYMVGGKPTTLADIRKEYERLMIDFANKSEEEQKIIKKMGEDLTKKEYDNRKKQLQNYVKYLTESMGERAQIEIKAMQDVNKIREDESLDAFSKEQAIMQRRKKMYEDLSKMDLDSLKSSDVYISVFKDLERASKEQLQYVLNKLRELQSTFKDLSPAQVKSIANEMKKIEDVLADKDSVKKLGTNLKDTIQYARQRNGLLREQTKLQDDVESNEKMLAAAQQYLFQLELKRESIQDKSSDEWRETNEEVLNQQKIVAEIESHIEGLQYRLEKVTKEITKGEQAWKGFQNGLSKVHQGMNQLKDSFDAIFDGLDSMGLVNDAFRDTYESIGDIISGIGTFMDGLESMDITKPFSIITGSIKSIGGIFQTIGAAFGIGDKKKERDIQKLTEKVETLDKAYQRLEKSIENAYTFSDYNAGYRQMQQTLEAEKTAYQEILALEKSKKKTDETKVKEYEEKLEEIADKQKELQKSLIEDFGSTTDYRGAAEDFVSAWLDAYKETGSGLDALSESWDEFIESLFVKQGAAQIVSARLKKVIGTINDAIESGATDFDLSKAVNDAREEWKKQAEIIEPLLEQLFGSYGLNRDGTGELILSDLQKGIQNITEPQAAAIEAYLNSMRFAVFRHTEQLDTLIATIQMQYGSGAENPVVTELKGIRGVLDNIYSTLRSVVKTSVGQTGIVIARN